MNTTPPPFFSDPSTGEPYTGPVGGLAFGGGEAPVGLSSSHIWPLGQIAIPPSPRPPEPPPEFDPYAEWQAFAVAESNRPPKMKGWNLRERLQDHPRQAPVLNMYVGGNYVHWHHPPTKGKRPLVDRGEVLGFSAASRLRLLRKMNMLDRDRIPPNSVWMVTLTYPGVWVDDPERWKRDLQVWRKRLTRQWGPLAVFWKLEAQRRGAPHFHLLIFTPHRMHAGMRVVGYRVHNGRQVPKWKGEAFHGFVNWCKHAWADVVGSKDQKHIDAGTSVEPTFTMKGAVYYAGKYLGKESEFIDKTTGEVRAVGRFWGVWNKELLPQAEKVRLSLKWEHWHRVRRWIARYSNRGNHPALNGATRSVGVFVPGAMVRRMVEEVAGEESYEPAGDEERGEWAVPGTYWEGIRRIEIAIEKRRAKEAERHRVNHRCPPPTPTELAAMFADEARPYLIWSADDGNCDNRTDYAN